MSDIDNIPAEDIAQAAAEVGAVVAALQPTPDTYISQRRGPTDIDSMDPTWAERAAHAVEEGRRPLNRPSVVGPLERRAHER